MTGSTPSAAKLLIAFWRDFLRRFRATFAMLALVMLVAVGLQLPTPILTMWVVDAGLAHGIAEVNRFAFLLLTLVVAHHAFHLVSETATLRLRETIVLELERRLWAHLQRLPLSFFAEFSASYLQVRIMNDARSVEGALVRILVSALTNGVTLIVGAAIVLSIRLDLGLAILASLVPFGAILAYANRKMREASLELGERTSVASAVMAESFAGVRTIKAMGQRRSRAEVVDRELFALRAANVGANQFAITANVGTSFVAELTTVFVVWYGMRAVDGGRMTIGALVALSSFIGFLYGPVSAFATADLSVQQAAAAIQRIYELLRRDPEPADGRALAGAAGRIELENVHFGYDPAVPVLSGVNLVIGAGEKLAVVGPSGAGKSTLVNLLLRFALPQTGRIRLDGQDIAELSLESLRRTIGVVDQQAFMFEGTIAENIRFGNPTAGDAEVERAARLCHAHEFIEALPAAYETRVGAHGVTLSTGQCQRIALARLVLRDPSVLILDEAVSAVDSESEALIRESLRHLAAGRTTLIVAHRLSSLLMADRIVLLDQGRIVEDGTHELLLAAKGRYSRLFHDQFRPDPGQDAELKEARA